MYVDSISELNMKNATWDIVVRRIEEFDEESRQGTIIFQFASRYAPHHLLSKNLEFELFEGPDVCVWQGIVLDVWEASRSHQFWVDQQ